MGATVVRRRWGRQMTTRAGPWGSRVLRLVLLGAAAVAVSAPSPAVAQPVSGTILRSRWTIPRDELWRARRSKGLACSGAIGCRRRVARFDSRGSLGVPVGSSRSDSPPNSMTSVALARTRRVRISGRCRATNRRSGSGSGPPLVRVVRLGCSALLSSEII